MYAVYAWWPDERKSCNFSEFFRKTIETRQALIFEFFLN